MEKGSAVYFAQQTQGFLKDHIHVSKPNGENDDNYLWVRQQLLRKLPDPRVQQYTDAEVTRLQTVIDRMQKELAGTDLEEALKLINQGKIKQARALLKKKPKSYQNPEAKRFR